MSTTTAPTTVPPSGQPRTRIGLLMGIAIGSLVLGLTAGLLLGRSTAPVSTSPEQASSMVEQMLADRVTAINSADPAAISSFYAADAVLEEHDQDPPRLTTTADEIGHHLAGYATMGFRIAQPGGSVAVGPYIGEPLRWSGGAGGISVYLIDDDGLIAHQWVVGGSVPDAAAAG